MVCSPAFAPDGRIQQLDVYDPDQLDEARACYAARPDPSSAALPSTDPLRIQPNAATRAGGRNLDAIMARDWEAVERSRNNFV